MQVYEVSFVLNKRLVPVLYQVNPKTIFIERSRLLQ